MTSPLSNFLIKIMMIIIVIIIAIIINKNNKSVKYDISLTII